MHGEQPMYKDRKRPFRAQPVKSVARDKKRICDKARLRRESISLSHPQAPNHANSFFPPSSSLYISRIKLFRFQNNASEQRSMISSVQSSQSLIGCAPLKFDGGREKSSDLGSISFNRKYRRNSDSSVAAQGFVGGRLSI